MAKVDFMFDRVGRVRASVQCGPEDALALDVVEDAINAEAEDFETAPGETADATELEVRPSRTLSHVSHTRTQHTSSVRI